MVAAAGAGMGEQPGVRVIDGRELKITTPGRVLYPATGTTKSDVLDYYAAVALVMLPHLSGRPATRKRWPEGVDGPAFFAKDVEPGTPVWLSRVQIRHRLLRPEHSFLDVGGDGYSGSACTGRPSS